VRYEEPRAGRPTGLPRDGGDEKRREKEKSRRRRRQGFECACEKLYTRRRSAQGTRLDLVVCGGDALRRMTHPPEGSFRPAADDLFFRGRTDDPRWGEWVRRLDAKEKIGALGTNDCVLYGCPGDVGVTRNRGRAGAAGGPTAIRRHLYKFAVPEILEKARFFDAGDVVGAEGPLPAAHEAARLAARSLTERGATLIALGGGHDFAAPNMEGLRGGLPQRTKLGAMNVDPHLDMRPLENGEANSGTPFRTLLDGKTLEGRLLVVFGARRLRNAAAHFRYAEERDVRIFELEEILGLADPARARLPQPAALFTAELRRLSRMADAVAVTIDIDCCRDAEGSSAAPVLGFSTADLVAFAAAAGRERRVRLLEIAEVAPSLDTNDRSARIAAELVAAFAIARAESANPKKR
jgi:formiminoglutamase